MGDKNKNFAVIGVSSILLVAAVVGTVTYGVSKKGGSSDDSGTASTSSKASQTMCQYTDYKDTCEKSLAKSGDSNDPNHLAQVAFQAAIEAVKGVMSNSTVLKDAASDPKTKQAFEVCQTVLDDSIDDLQRSVEKISGFGKDDFDLFVNDLTTWLSGAATFQETCLDAFENTTGDTGEKMKNIMKTTSQLTSNGLAIVSQLHELLSSFQIPGFSRRLLEEEEGGSGSERRVMYDDYYNTEHKQRSLLGKGGPAPAGGATPLANLKPNCIVAQDGSGQFKTIQAAVDTAPLKVNQTFVILVKAGIYKEYVRIPKKAYNVYMIGEGPTKTRITGNKNVVDGTTTFLSATLAVEGDNFIAKDIGVENTAGANKHQAVAVRATADRVIFYNCHFEGYQDTLYAHNHRQYYRDCTITGTIDFIFGDAAAVFQNCKMVVRKPMSNQACMVTAQGRKESRGKGAFVLQGCTITGEPEFMATKPMPDAFLGRPWKEYSRTIVMQSFIDNVIVPAGWSEWAGTFALDTLSYAEYQNRGPGSNTAQRVHWKGIKTLSPQQAASFTPGPYIDGHFWIEGTGLPYEPSMMKV